MKVKDLFDILEQLVEDGKGDYIITNDTDTELEIAVFESMQNVTLY